MDEWPWGPPGSIKLDESHSQYPEYRQLIVVSPLGCLNGYTNVPVGHPAFGSHEDMCLQGTCGSNFYCDHSLSSLISVHGGITYTGYLADLEEDQWWIGFDTGHSFDYVPGMASYYKRVGYPHIKQLRDPEYVLDQIDNMICQLVTIPERLSPVSPPDWPQGL